MALSLIIRSAKVNGHLAGNMRCFCPEDRLFSGDIISDRTVNFTKNVYFQGPFILLLRTVYQSGRVKVGGPGPKWTVIKVDDPLTF